MGYSVEELIRLAKQESSEVKQQALDQVHRFIINLKIKPGKHKVKNKVLYRAYKMWAINPQSLNSFFVYFSKFFIQERTATYRYYMLNYHALELLNRIDNLKRKMNGKEK